MEKHIETILDYNPTEQEWKRFGFKGESHFMKYYQGYIKSNDNINYQLGLLFCYERIGCESQNILVKNGTTRFSKNSMAGFLDIHQNLCSQ